MKTEPISWKRKLEALKLAFRWIYASSKFLTVSIIVLSVLGGLITIVEPYIFKIIIDRIVNNSGTVNIKFNITLGLVGIFLGYAAARISQGMFWDTTNIIRRMQVIRIEKHALHEMMDKITDLDLEYFEDPEYYNTLSKATSSFYRISEIFNSSTAIITELVAALVIIFALLTFNWIVVLVIMLGAVPGVFFAIKSTEDVWSAFYYSSPIAKHAHYYKSLLTENVQAAKEIKTFGLKEHFLKKFKELFTSFIKKQDEATISQIKWHLIIGIIEGILSVIAAFLVVKGYLDGKITIGELTFFWSLLFQFAAHMRWTVRLLGDANTHATFITPILDVIGFKHKIKDSGDAKQFPKKLKEGIEFRNLTFSYPKSKKIILDNFNLKIKPGESIAIVGENGSGKTTLIKLMCRLYDTDKGEVLIDGVDIKNYKIKDLMNNIGVIFQDFMKYEALVEENIKYGHVEKNTYSGKIHEAALKSGAWDFIKELDKKYKTPLGKKILEGGVDLSGGQWQKIALSRAFLKNAPILILDEPTSAVDAKAEFELFKRFEEFSKGKITFLISHRFSTVRMASKIVVVEKGKIIEVGSHEELLRKNGIYAKLFNMQARGYK